MRGSRIFFIVLVGCSFHPVQTSAKTAEQLVLKHSVVSFKYGDIMPIRVQVNRDVQWVRLFIRYQGVKSFQVRNMKKKDIQTYTYDLDTGELPSLEVEYYFTAREKDKESSFPAKAPEEIIKVFGTSPEPVPKIPSDLAGAAKRKIFLPLNVSIAADKIVSQKKTATPQSERTNAAGNFAVSYSLQNEALGLNLDSNMPFDFHPPQGYGNLDLTNLVLSITKNEHTVRAGDLMVQESEFSIGAVGRRGVEYIFAKPKLSFHAFNVSAQQPKGFSGIGIPKADISLLGGSVEYKPWGRTYSVRAVFVTGKDDPALGKNIGIASYYEGRKGNVFALVQNALLFKEKMSLKAELALSSSSGLDSTAKRSAGTAFSLRGNYRTGILSLGGNYLYVEKDFNPIGYQFFTNDRTGQDVSLGLSFGRVSLTGMYNFSRNNLGDNPTDYTSRYKNGSVGMSWNPNDKTSLILQYRNGHQETDFPGMPQFFRDVLSQDLSGNVSIVAGPSSSINFSLTGSDLTSKTHPDQELQNLTANFGISYRPGVRFLLAPNIGLTLTRNKHTRENTISYNSFFTAEVTLVPQVLTLSTTSSFAHTEFFAGSPSDTLSVAGNINIHLQRLMKIASMMLILTGNYQGFWFQSTVNPYWNIRVRWTLAF